MQQNNLDELWEELGKAVAERAVAEENFRQAREALVSRLCECYRDGEDWEGRATLCARRLTNTCPYFIELKQRSL